MCNYKTKTQRNGGAYGDRTEYGSYMSIYVEMRQLKTFGRMEETA